MRLMSNVRWLSLSQAVRITTQLISVTVLARLLPPEAYGLMAMATVVTNFAYLFRDLGTGAALIQAREVRPALQDTLHWSIVLFGLLLALALTLMAPLVARIFREPELLQVLCLLAWIFPLASLGVVRQAMLEREQAFARVAMAEIAAALLALLLALGMAWAGAGVYSLVAQVIVATLISTVLLAALAGFRPHLRWQRSEFAAVAGFSGNLSLFNLVLYLARNADSMVIGRLLGSAPLGIYALAYRVMLFPVQNMSHVASRALYPVLSRCQDDVASMAALYLRTLGFIAFLAAPLMAGLFALREPFVQAVFGPQWSAVAGVLAWLAPVGFLQAVVSTTGTVCMARGRTGLMLRLGVFSTVLQLVAFLVGARWGIEGVAACYLLANLINAVPALYFSGRLIGVGMRQIFACLALPMAGAALMALVLSVVQTQFAASFHTAIQVLLPCVLLGALVYLCASALLLRPQLGQLRLLLSRSGS